MIKTLVSAVALAIILQGCGDDSKSDNESKAEVSSEIKSFAKSLVGDDEISKIVKKGASSATSETKTSNKLYQKTMTESCEDGGTREITSSIDIENIMDEGSLDEIMSDGFSVGIVADSCIEDGLKSSGSMQMVVSDSITTITFIEDSSFEELETTEVFTVFKDSTIEIDEVSDEIEKITESVKAESSTGEKYETVALITHEIFKDDSMLSYETSGSVVHGGVKYRVDEKYDGSKTPMILKDYEDLVSGIAKYYNEKDQHIIVEVIDKNRIKISVDTDDDGDIDEEEIISI